MHHNHHKKKKKKKVYKHTCDCGKNSICATHSKIKIKYMPKYNVLMPNNNSRHYSYLRYNNLPIDEIVKKMLYRLNPQYENLYNVILIYDNNTDTLLYKIKP